MKAGIDRRHDPRAPLSPLIEVNTPKGIFKGKTANISISALALLLFIELPNIGNAFEITIKLSEDHEAPVTCQKIWTGSMDLGGMLAKPYIPQLAFSLSKYQKKTVKPILF